METLLPHAGSFVLRQWNFFSLSVCGGQRLMSGVWLDHLIFESGSLNLELINSAGQ